MLACNIIIIIQYLKTTGILIQPGNSPVRLERIRGGRRETSLSRPRSLYLGRGKFCLNTPKIRRDDWGTGGLGECERSWYHHLIFTLSGGASTGSIIHITTRIFNMKIIKFDFCLKVLRLNFTQFCGLRLCQMWWEGEMKFQFRNIFNWD